MALKEYKSKMLHYWVDELNRQQGEFKSWFYNGKQNVHCFLIDGKLHGEFKRWYANGQLDTHTLYNMNTDLKINPSTLTDKEKFILTLRYNIEWL